MQWRVLVYSFLASQFISCKVIVKCVKMYTNLNCICQIVIMSIFIFDCIHLLTFIVLIFMKLCKDFHAVLVLSMYL